MIETRDTIGARARRLNDAAAPARAAQRLDQALGPHRVALVSSFGADSVVLLHMLAHRAPDTPVLFLDTEMLFPETLRYQLDLAETLGLTDIRRITPDRTRMFLKDPDGLLHRTDTTACCHLRKTEPLLRALEGFDGWVTGRKRHQTPERASLAFVESDGGRRLKFNPLADWSGQDVADYFDAHALPRHPLVARGYRSIGCAPCTTPVAPGQDDRAGRWAGEDKTECGIHIENGRLYRASAPDLQKEPT